MSPVCGASAGGRRGADGLRSSSSQHGCPGATEEAGWVGWAAAVQLAGHSPHHSVTNYQCHIILHLIPLFYSLFNRFLW